MLRKLLPQLWPSLPFSAEPDWELLFHQHALNTAEVLSLSYTHTEASQIDPSVGGSHWSESLTLDYWPPGCRYRLQITHEDVAWAGPRICLYLHSDWPPGLAAWEPLCRRVQTCLPKG